MIGMIVTFADLFLASLVTGAMFGVWLFFGPRNPDAARYVVLHQQGVRALDRMMPILGAGTILLTFAGAAVARADEGRFALIAGGALAFLAAGAITRFGNQPINQAVMRWSVAEPPAEWRGLRDRWRRWHAARLLCGLGGLASLIVAELLRGAAWR